MTNANDEGDVDNCLNESTNCVSHDIEYEMYWTDNSYVNNEDVEFEDSLSDHVSQIDHNIIDNVTLRI